MEFLYTRQQMEGFKGYQSKVKIGNWSEDLELEAAKLKAYLMKKERGELKCTQAEDRFAHALQPAVLQPKTNDGYVHFGDTVMLFNQATDGCLACDPQEPLQEGTFATTSTWYTEPCSRNTFHIFPWQGRGDKKDAMFDFRDDIVHFGQKIQIRANPALGANDAVLASYPRTPTSFSRYSRNLEVVMQDKSNWSSVWEVQYLDPQVALLHCGTHQHLASDVIKYRNDYGTEYEVFGKSFSEVVKGQLGVRERTMLGDCNRWCFVTAIPSDEGEGGAGGEGQGGDGGPAEAAPGGGEQ